MPRDVNLTDMLNLWGRATDAGEEDLGLEAQRADLWLVDFTIPANNLVRVTDFYLSPILPQYAKTLTMPEQKVNTVEVRRDSMPFQMPDFDAPLGELKITFWYDNTLISDGSKVMNFLELWQRVVRAGRGDRGTMYYGRQRGWLTLDENYRADYASDFLISFVRGNTSTQPDARLQVVEDYRVKQAWLSGYRVTDLSYAGGTELVSVEATFYCEDIVRDTPQRDQLGIGPLIPLPGT